MHQKIKDENACVRVVILNVIAVKTLVQMVI